jgi:hypothetical protein
MVTQEYLQTIQDLMLNQPMVGTSSVTRTPDVGSIEPLSARQLAEIQNTQLSNDPVIANMQRLGRSVGSFLTPKTPLDTVLMGVAPLKVTKGLLQAGTGINTSYRMAHQPRGREFDDVIQLDDLTKDVFGNRAGYPKDFYGPKGQQIYAPGPSFAGDTYGLANKESYNIIQQVRNRPNAEVTIYRAVPKGINKINEGDFVTLSPQYAKLHAASGYGRSGDEAGQVLTAKVKVKDLVWDANDINEFGYFPIKK